MCSPCSGARVEGRPGVVELRGRAYQRPPSGVAFHRVDVTVGHDLRVGGRLGRGLHDRPRRGQSGQNFEPLVEVAGGEELVEHADAFGGVGQPGLAGGEARIRRADPCGSITRRSSRSGFR